MLDFISQCFYLILNLLTHTQETLLLWASQYGAWIYLIGFIIVFAETGFVVTPFLPGDSLLFAFGILVATLEPDLNFIWMYLILFSAAVIGDAVNYSFGRSNLVRTFLKRWIKPKYEDQAKLFFQKHGGKSVVMARFVPFVRTYLPFIAGSLAMPRAQFTKFNVLGAFLWVTICYGLGYVFGDLPVVRRNMGLIAIGIVFVSVLPVAIEILRFYIKKSKGAQV